MPRQRGKGSRGAASQGHAGPWAQATAPERHEAGTSSSPSHPLPVCAIALENSSQREKGRLGGGGALGTRGPPPSRAAAHHPHGRRDPGKEPDLRLLAQQGAGLDPAEPVAPEPLPRSPAPPSEEIWGFLHGVSRLRRCVNWIRWEAERRRPGGAAQQSTAPARVTPAEFAEPAFKRSFFPRAFGKVKLGQGCGICRLLTSCRNPAWAGSGVTSPCQCPQVSVRQAGDTATASASPAGHPQHLREWHGDPGPPPSPPSTQPRSANPRWQQAPAR